MAKAELGPHMYGGALEASMTLALGSPLLGSGWEGALRVLSIRDLAPSVQERYQKQ